MPGEINTFDAIRRVVNSTTNPTDQELREAFREVLDAFVFGYAQPWVVTDLGGVPTDIAVQAAVAEGVSGREVYDGLVVATRGGAGGKLTLYQRIAGAWIGVDDAP